MDIDRFLPFVGGYVTFTSYAKDLAYARCTGIKEEDFFYIICTEQWCTDNTLRRHVTSQDRVHELLSADMLFVKSRYDVALLGESFELHHKSILFQNIRITAHKEEVS